MSAIDTQLHGNVFVHTGANHLGLAMAQVQGRPHSGLVYTGAPDGIAEAMFRQIPGRVMLDAGRWRRTTASVEDPFGLAGLSGQGSLLPTPTLADVARQAPPAAAWVLSPTGFIPAGRADLMTRVLSEAVRCGDPRLVPLIPTDATVLDHDRLRMFLRILTSVSIPTALILTGTGQPLGAAGRVAGLRTLLDAVPGIMVLACEPAIALDAALRGASTTSVGVTGTLRRPGPPGTTGFANGYISGMFLRDLWEYRSPATYAEWHEGRPGGELACAACPERRRFSSFDSGGPDKTAILTHSLHSWLGLLDELVELHEPRGRVHLADDRREGLVRHALLRPHAPLTEFDRVIRQYVELDDGELPASLSGRPRT